MFFSTCVMHLSSLECPVPTQDQDSHFCLHLYAEKCPCLGAVLKKKLNFRITSTLPLSLIFVPLNLIFFIYIYSAFSSRKNSVTLTHVMPDPKDHSGTI